MNVCTNILLTKYVIRFPFGTTATAVFLVNNLDAVASYGVSSTDPTCKNTATKSEVTQRYTLTHARPTTFTTYILYSEFMEFKQCPPLQTITNIGLELGALDFQENSTQLHYSYFTANCMCKAHWLSLKSRCVTLPLSELHVVLQNCKK